MGSPLRNLRSFQYRNRYIRPGPRMTVDQPAPRVRNLQTGVSQVLADRLLELPEGEDRLHQAGRPDRVAAGQEPAGGIYRDPPPPAVAREAEAVIDGGKEGGSRIDVTP